MKACLILMFLSISAGIVFGTAPQFRPAIDHAIASKHVLRGMHMWVCQDRKGAIAEYNQALILDPNYGLAYFGRGENRVMLGDYAGAVPDLDRVSKLMPNLAGTYMLRGRARLRLAPGLPPDQRVIDDYRKAVSLQPALSAAVEEDLKGAEIAVEYRKGCGISTQGKLP